MFPLAEKMSAPCDLIRQPRRMAKEFEFWSNSSMEPSPHCGLSSFSSNHSWIPSWKIRRPCNVRTSVSVPTDGHCAKRDGTVERATTITNKWQLTDCL